MQNMEQHLSILALLAGVVNATVDSGAEELLIGWKGETYESRKDEASREVSARERKASVWQHPAAFGF